jgi:HK97 family phage portal protein
MRPDPFTTPQVFYRNTAFHLARRGEVWWWIAARDGDGQALSVLPVDPREVTVEDNPRNPLRPRIFWRGRSMSNDDMRQITFLPDPDNPHRGYGPLQACGAAVSVAVESQEWAANFFANGGVPSILIKAMGSVDQPEADLLREQWMSRPSNVPRVIDEGIESVTTPGVNPENAQLTEGRMFQVGEVARMYGIPGPLLEYNASGSSLHYQNDESIWRQFQASCLTPNYLEPIEQTMSDLLTRSTIARFSLDGLLRADTMTRYQVHAIAIDKGIYDATEAARREGLEPGDVENRPIPFSAPAAIPTILPIQARTLDFRCSSCGRKLAEAAGPGTLIRCRCGVENSPPEVMETRAPAESPALTAAVLEFAAHARQDRQTFAERTDRMIAALADRPIHVESPVTIAEGAIAVHVANTDQPADPERVELVYDDEGRVTAVQSA